MDFVAMQCSLMSFLGTFIERAKRIIIFAVTLIIGSVFFFILTFFFALVGTLLGALNGGFLGQYMENGFIRRAVVGAIVGANFSLQVFEYCLLLWRSGESVMGCLKYLIDVIDSILSSILRALERRIYDNAMRFDEVQNIFVTLTTDNNERVSFTVSLQEFQPISFMSCITAIIK